MKVEELTDVVDQLVGTQVDRFVYCLVVPRVFLHDTRVGERAWKLVQGKYSNSYDFRRAENARHLVEQGHDPVRVLGERAHEKGLQYFVSQRMNDAHFAYSREGTGEKFLDGDILAPTSGVADWRQDRALFSTSVRLLTPGSPRRSHGHH